MLRIALVLCTATREAVCIRIVRALQAKHHANVSSVEDLVVAAAMTQGMPFPHVAASLVEGIVGRIATLETAEIVKDKNRTYIALLIVHLQGTSPAAVKTISDLVRERHPTARIAMTAEGQLSFL